MDRSRHVKLEGVLGLRLEADFPADGSAEVHIYLCVCFVRASIECGFDEMQVGSNRSACLRSAVGFESMSWGAELA